MSPSGDKKAFTVKVGEKGQIVIPREARDMFNIKPGDNIIILADRKQGMAIPPQSMFDNVYSLVFGGGKEAEAE